MGDHFPLLPSQRQITFQYCPFVQCDLCLTQNIVTIALFVFIRASQVSSASGCLYLGHSTKQKFYFPRIWQTLASILALNKTKVVLCPQDLADSFLYLGHSTKLKFYITRIWQTLGQGLALVLIHPSVPAFSVSSFYRDRHCNRCFKNILSRRMRV